MTLDEAINRLYEDINSRSKQYSLSLAEADKLGIEALKRLKEYREWHRSTADGPLPGETKE